MLLNRFKDSAVLTMRGRRCLLPELDRLLATALALLLASPIRTEAQGVQIGVRRSGRSPPQGLPAP